MTVIYYFEKDDSAAERYKGEAAAIPDDVTVLFFDDFSLFIGYLELPKHDQHIAIVSITDELKLMELISRYQVFWNIRFIVLIPENHEELIGRIHLLHPRYIGHTETNIKDVSSVLFRMLEASDNTATQHYHGERTGIRGNGHSSITQAAQ